MMPCHSLSHRHPSLALCLGLVQRSICELGYVPDATRHRVSCHPATPDEKAQVLASLSQCVAEKATKSRFAALAASSVFHPLSTHQPQAVKVRVSTSARCRKTSGPLTHRELVAFFYLDVDDFEHNDTASHFTGDAVFRKFGSLLKAHGRQEGYHRPLQSDTRTILAVHGVDESSRYRPP